MGQDVEATWRTEENPDFTKYTPPRVDGLEFLKRWRRDNPTEYSEAVSMEQESPQSEDTAEEAKTP